MEDEKGVNLEKVKYKRRRIIMLVLLCIQVIAAACLFAKLQTVNVVPKVYQVLIIVLIVVLNVLSWFATKKKNLTILMSCVTTILSGAMVFLTVTISSLDSSMDEVFKVASGNESVEMAVVVRADDPANTMTPIFLFR